MELRRKYCIMTGCFCCFDEKGWKSACWYLLLCGGVFLLFMNRKSVKSGHNLSVIIVIYMMIIYLSDVNAGIRFFCDREMEL